MHALEADHDFLTAGSVFSEEMIRQWIDYKRKRSTTRCATARTLMR